MFPITTLSVFSLSFASIEYNVGNRVAFPSDMPLFVSLSLLHFAT